MAAAGAQLQRKLRRLRQLVMSLAAISYVLQSLVAIGAVSRHSTSPVIGAAPPSVACIAQKPNDRSSAPEHDDGPSCCLLFGARGCNAPQAAFDMLCACVHQLPDVRPQSRRSGLAVDKRGGLSTAGSRSWSARAPPLFS